MNREQLVEKAGKAAWDHDTEKHGLSPAYGWRPPGEDALNESYRSVAAAVVDALLPQVTTVEELEALDRRSVLVFEAGPYSLVLRFQNGRLHGDSWVGSLEQAIAELGSLTVVWSPS